MIDHLIMCSKCEVRMHPDDYEKHKAFCRSNINEPMQVPCPVYPFTSPPWEPPYKITRTDGTHWGENPNISITGVYQ